MSTKQKRAIFFIGITGAVYLSFRYLLPLVIPFLIAALIAHAIWPIVRFMHTHWKVPETLGAALILIIIVGLLLIILYFVGGGLIEQFRLFMEKLPSYMEMLSSRLSTISKNVEVIFSLETGSIMEQLLLLEQGMQQRAVDNFMPMVMSNSVPIIVRIGEIFAVAMITFISTIFFIKERKDVARFKESTVFRREIRVITRRLSSVGESYLKTELTIMALTTAICMLGLTLTGNRYGILIGAVLGFLDALPLFGTGTVFIPWVIICIFNGDFIQAAEIATIYFVCYVVREFLEAKLLGDRIGMTSLETIISMYIGLQLFGVFGLFLGPIGWILIKEIDKNYEIA